MRFLAIIGAPGSACDRLFDLPCRYDAPGVQIYGDQPVHVGRNGLIIVGILQDSGRSKPREATEAAHKFSALVDDAWGSYIAIGLASGHRAVEIFVDPSGRMPCYRLERDNMLFLSSDARTTFCAAGMAAEIDWNRVALQLLRREWRGSATALEGLGEVPAGSLLTWSPEQETTHPLWSPRRFALVKDRSTFEQAAVRLRHAVNSAVRLEFADHGKILVGISGGMDSSIVAASLAAAGYDITCFTMYSEGDEGDERPYARLLADHLGVPLKAYPYKVEDIDLGTSGAASLPRPMGWPFQQSLDTACKTAFAETGADVIARGTGGDSVFCYHNSAASVVDAFAQRGPGAAWRSLLDVCGTTGASIWSASTLALKRALPGGRTPKPRWDRSMLTDDVIHHSAASERHPWLEECRDLLPGKQRHIDLIGATHNFLEARLVLDADIICPLLSQPVLETALGIGAPHWIKDGRNRAVAREAFRDRLPTAIVERSTKGGPTGFAARVYKSRLQQVREILMDGQLASRGITDRQAVEKATSGTDGDLPENYVRLLALVDAEAWARGWQSAPQG